MIMKGKLILEGKEFEVTLSGFEFSDINTCPEICVLVRDNISEFRELMFSHMVPVEKMRFKEELSDEIIDLPESPIECATLLIDSCFEYDTSSFQRAFGMGEKACDKRYSVSELRQIAEHLLVYCKHNEESDNE